MPDNLRISNRIWLAITLAALSAVALACGSSASPAAPAANDPVAASSAPGAAPPVASASPRAPAPPSLRPSFRAGGRALERYGRRSPFVPLDNPEFVTAGQASYLSDDELVLGLYVEGEARAYPVRTVFYHHIVNDWVGGRPILVTY